MPLEQSWLTGAGSEDFARLVDYRDEYTGRALADSAWGSFPKLEYDLTVAITLLPQP